MNYKLAALAAAAALALTGCATSTDSAPAPAATAAPAPAMTDEDKFYANFVEYGGSRVYNTSRAESIRMAYQMCGLLDDGNTVDDLIEAMAETDTGDDAAMQAMAALLAAAVTNLCPEYGYQMDSI